MRCFMLVLALCLPTFGKAADRFGDWVTRELGYEPFYAQSIGWEMPEFSVTVADPLTQAVPEGDFLQTPPSTAWVVGIMKDAADARLLGLALVWADGPFDSAVDLGKLQTQSGFVAFQTPRQTSVSIGLPQDIAEKMSDQTPGPILAQQPDGTFFPVGDSGFARGCLQITALYADTKELIALIVLADANARVDTDEVACAMLTS